HLVAFGTYIIDLGPQTVFLYAFEMREKILRLFEEVSGARMLYNYIWVGGLWNDWSDEQLARVAAFCDEMEVEAKKYYYLNSTNKIFINRTANVGVMITQDCFDFAATGPVLRGSGYNWDLRKNMPYSLYEEFDFAVSVGTGEIGQVGHCY